MAKKNYSNVKSRVKKAKEGKGGNFVPMIPEGEDSATHILRFLSGKVELSKSNNIQAVLKCQVRDRKNKELNKKDENLYFLLEHPNAPWQSDHFLAIMDGLGLDFAARVPEDMDHDGWNDIFDDMEDSSSNIDFEVEYSYQYEKNGDKKKGYDKRVNFDALKAIAWPNSAAADDADEGEDEDDTP